MSLTPIVSTTKVLAWCHFSLSLVLNRCTCADYNGNLFVMCATLIVNQHHFLCCQGIQAWQCQQWPYLSQT